MVGFTDNSDAEKNFYERNIGKPVNLITSHQTYSGDLESYDAITRTVRLENCIIRKYNADGSSKFTESESIVEIDESIVTGRFTTTLEDRLGRIAAYNRDLFIEERKKQAELPRDLIIIP